jgi:acetyl esterase/lipase
MLNPDKVAMLGFSAGGHLALSQTLFHQRDFANAPGIIPSLCSADALLLAYPVITSGIYAHRGSFSALLGESPKQKLLDLLSLEKQIGTNGNAALPPVFLWHTYADESVLVENSFLLAEALRRASVPLEMHIFPEGRHGLSLAIPETNGGETTNVNLHAAQWFSLCLNWLKMQFGII